MTKKGKRRKRTVDIKAVTAIAMNARALAEKIKQGLATHSEISDAAELLAQQLEKVVE